MIALVLLLLGTSATSRAETPAKKPVAAYSGMSDASAAVALGKGLLLVADDEKNVLKVYRNDRPGKPIGSIPWDESLGIDPASDKHPEVDIEGATIRHNTTPRNRDPGSTTFDSTSFDSVICWIASHGRNKNGKWRANRHQLFAMTVSIDPADQVGPASKITAKPFGKPYRTLALDLAADPRMKKLGLDDALRVGEKESSKLAPKREGLNIEGLAATPDGNSLLIGLRNPIPDDKALLVRLLNPAAVLCNGARPEFDDPIQLPLEVRKNGEVTALGIRSIEYSPRRAAYLIVAGPSGKGGPFGFFRWSGKRDEVPELLRGPTEIINKIDGFTPEALIVYPGSRTVELLSDDGSRLVRVGSPNECEEDAFENGWCEAKSLRDDTRKTFRRIRLDVP